MIAARESAARGLHVAVFEEDPIIGRPERCAGLYSVDGMKRLGIPVNGPYLQRLVRGAVFVSPSGRVFEVDAGRDVAAVCNRERMDQFLAEQAISMGVELFLNTRVTETVLVGDHVMTRAKDLEVLSRYLVIAEGRAASTARKIFPNYRLGKWLPIIQYQISNHGQCPDMVYLYFRHYLQDFFGYLVPVDDDIGKLGVAASKSPDRLAAKLISEFFPRSRLLGVSSSSIYVGKPLQNPRRGPVMLVGDVAGQTKATTGGGVITGGMAAFAAAKHAAGEGLYEELLKPLLKELNRMYLLRKIYELIPSHMFDILFQTIRDSGFDKKVGEVGEMDRHMFTLVKTISGLQALKLAASLLKNLLSG